MAEQKACALCTLSHNISSAPASTRPPFRYTIWTTPPSSFACSTSTNSSCCTQESTLKTILRCYNSSGQLAVLTHLRLASVEVSFDAALFHRVRHTAGARDPTARSRSQRVQFTTVAAVQPRTQSLPHYARTCTVLQAVLSPAARTTCLQAEGEFVPPESGRS